MRVSASEDPYKMCVSVEQYESQYHLSPLLMAAIISIELSMNLWVFPLKCTTYEGFEKVNHHHICVFFFNITRIREKR